MTTTSSSFVRASRWAGVLVGLVLLGTVLAACGSSNNSATTTTTSASATSSATTSPSTSGSSSLSKLESLSSTIQGAEKATFKSVYTITNAGMTQTVTIEQSPPKSLFITKGGSVIDTGTATYFCSTTSTPETCISEGSSNPLASLVAIFSPATVLAGLREAQAEAGAHAAGYSLSFSSGSYAGQSTTCANISGAGHTAKYCVTKQGILAYVSSNSGGSFALTSYSSSPPASDFALPAGATVETIPTGVPGTP